MCENIIHTFASGVKMFLLRLTYQSYKYKFVFYLNHKSNYDVHYNQFHIQKYYLNRYK